MEIDKRNRILKNFFEILVTSVLTLMINLSIIWLAQPNVNLIISTPYYDSSNYTYSISIQNLSRKLIEIDLCVDTTTTLLNVTKVNNSVVDYTAGIITISDIHPKSNICILVTTNNQLQSKNFHIGNDISAYVNFTDQYRTIPIYTWVTIGSQIVLYSIMVIIVNKIYDKRIGKLNEETQSLKDKIEENSKEIKDNERSLSWLKVYYIKRFSDYSKELEFWKNTIRKILYTVGKEPLDADKLFNSVTENLKTFTTKESKIRFKEIMYISQNLKEEEED